MIVGVKVLPILNFGILWRWTVSFISQQLPVKNSSQLLCDWNFHFISFITVVSIIYVYRLIERLKGDNEYKHEVAVSEWFLWIQQNSPKNVTNEIAQRFLTAYTRWHIRTLIIKQLMFSFRNIHYMFRPQAIIAGVTPNVYKYKSIKILRSIKM
jgi:hypothetical protein